MWSFREPLCQSFMLNLNIYETAEKSCSTSLREQSLTSAKLPRGDINPHDLFVMVLETQEFSTAPHFCSSVMDTADISADVNVGKRRALLSRCVLLPRGRLHVRGVPPLWMVRTIQLHHQTLPEASRDSITPDRFSCMIAFRLRPTELDTSWPDQSSSHGH
ncbi:hypothetical protein RRG08_053060 [Elysia crispata]|uniref:Uncharacterized protein n=1 Tax=Elysia crispata TaxID=231223 RepID=A0AAE1CLQ0_9GAST|nr:hypothetical protein RRG08_053060 [Elysia crispata]